MEEKYSAKTRPWVVVLCGALIAVALVGVVDIRNSERQAKHELARGDLQAAQTDLLYYAQDNDETLPPAVTATDYKSKLDPYQYTNVQDDPYTSKPFQFNIALSAKKLKEIPNAYKTIAFYQEGSNDGYRMVTYAGDERVFNVEDSDWPRVKRESGIP
jgi:hypothetical protein